MRLLRRLSVPLLLLAVIAPSIHAQGGGGGRGGGRGGLGPIAGPFDSTAVGDTSIFAPLPWHEATPYRTAAGAPGPLYWQQRVDYALKATLDTGAKDVHGQETIHYTNHSPDTLRYIWMQVEQNAFKSGSMNSYVFDANSRFGARGFEGGDIIDHFDQLTGVSTAPVRKALATRVEGTMMKVDLAQPLAPGQIATFDVAWHFLVPLHGSDRMGRDGALFEIAQWYPRLCVYDAVRGWNTDPYLGQGEFYLEYGDFTLDVTVPAGYIVAATGILQNAAEVLTPAEAARLAKAGTSDTAIHIVTQAELTSGAARPKKTGTLTWKFQAHNTRDAVFAASPDYLWDGSSWKGHLAFGYYRQSAADLWKESADMSRMSIMEYSERWFTYPYPQISAVEGPISGMEYPMLAMETHSRDKYDLYNVITHEIGHNWYPMIVGSNERLHMWQDEGFNTFINLFSEARRYPERGDQMTRAAAERREVEQAMSRRTDQPLEINADRINPNLLGENAYTKTSVALQQLRQEVLGAAAFDDAFREYTRRWSFKHPTPEDFFRTMEDVSGRRLDWFWREWFFENPHFDQAIDTVTTRAVGDSTLITVRYVNRARGVEPIRARFTYSDGTTEDFAYPAEVWSTNTRGYVRTYTITSKKKLTKIQLDPDNRLVDIDRTNNTWTSPAPAGGSGRRH